MAKFGPMYRREGKGRNWGDLHLRTQVVEATYEPRLRRAAERLGFRLEKSKAQDPSANGFGTFQLVHMATGEKITGKDAGPVGRRLVDDDGNYGLLIDRVHRILVSRGAPDLWHNALEPMSKEELARYSKDG